jgi:hypothetical protein
LGINFATKAHKSRCKNYGDASSPEGDKGAITSDPDDSEDSETEVLNEWNCGESPTFPFRLDADPEVCLTLDAVEAAKYAEAVVAVMRRLETSAELSSNARGFDIAVDDDYASQGSIAMGENIEISRLVVEHTGQWTYK